MKQHYEVKNVHVISRNISNIGESETEKPFLVIGTDIKYAYVLRTCACMHS